MSSYHSTSEKKDSKQDFDFDEWHELSLRSPEEFELKRQRLCQQIIADAPAKSQKRLEGLLFQINMQRRKSSNPLDSCIQLSNMMWDSFYELFDEVKKFSDASSRFQPISSSTDTKLKQPKLKLVHSR